MKKNIIILSVLTVLLLSGCQSAKMVPYVIEAETIPAELLQQTKDAQDPRIVPGDLLNILVTSTNMAAALPFNKGKYIEDGRVATVNGNSQTWTNRLEAEATTETYLVDAAGDIDFPIIGKIHVGGLTKNQVIQKIQNEIYPKYMKEVPSVDVRVANFRVTILGQVRNPGVVRAPNERLNLFEALAMCGDLDIRGRRDNVLLIRTNYDGTREVVRLNLQDKDLILSPYFQLQQNDQIYVEPNTSAANQSWGLAPGVTATISVFGGVSSLASLIIGIINLSK